MDLAVLQLEANDISRACGFYGVNSHWDEKDKSILICGYPEVYNHEQNNERRIIGIKCNIIEITQDKLYYSGFLSNGMKGAPILRKNTQGIYEIIGIHMTAVKKDVG